MCTHAKLTQIYATMCNTGAGTGTGTGSDNNSAVYELPSDALLIGWARAKLGLPPIPGPPPAPPTPLPPQPAPTYPNTCVGRCWREGHCCANMVSGCSTPSCYQGCGLAQAAPSLDACNAACTAAGGKCSYTFHNVCMVRMVWYGPTLMPH